jgi:hypothetical protein
MDFLLKVKNLVWLVSFIPSLTPFYPNWFRKNNGSSILLLSVAGQPKGPVPLARWISKEEIKAEGHRTKEHS